MKKILLFISFFLVSTYCFGQKENSHVMVSAGNTIIHQDMYLDWVVGENIIDYDVLFNLNMQDKGKLAKEEAGFIAYPTITADKLNIASSGDRQGNLSVELYDLSQRKLKNIKWETNPLEIDLSGFAHGMYLLKVRNKDSETLAIFKIIKN